MHWAAKYIGKPWVPGGRGPDAFDCWGLLRWVEHHELGRSLLPEYQVPADDKEGVVRALESAVVAGEWTKLAAPEDGCAVGLSHSRKLHHVGVYLAVDGGLVLHALEGRGILAQPLGRLRADGWRRIDFYSFHSWQKVHA